MNVLREIAEWLMRWGIRRWVMFVCGLLVAFVTAGFVETPLWLAAQAGLMAAIVVGFSNECIAEYVYGTGDYVSWEFSVVGGVTGALLYTIARMAI